jgi:predicted RNA-binding protein YlqC (UPF0109 family)
VSIDGEYEQGDINTIAESDEDDEFEDDEDDYEDGDVNALSTESPADDDDMAGNRSEDATATAVLTYLARALADEPDAVVVETEERRGGLRLRLHVAPEDMGRVIGRRGRTAQAIRALVGAAAAHDGAQASVDIVDD